MRSPGLAIFIPLVVLVGLAACLVTVRYAVVANGEHGFPLDDPWIHLQFAKNLHDHGAFSYYKDQMVTSGSTSPLYTMILTAGFFVSDDAMVLSYTLGIIFFLWSGVVLFILARRLLTKIIWFAPVAALLVILEPHLQWVALSGMETTLFIALLLTTWLSYLLQRSVLLGITAGLLLWTRPEALIILAVLAVDTLYRHFMLPYTGARKGGLTRQTGTTFRIGRSFWIFLLFLGAYAGFNLILSGSIFPNTFAAKVKYYAGGGADYPLQVFQFLTGGHLVIPAIAAAVGLLAIIIPVIRGQYSQFLVPFLLSLGFIAAYWIYLPYLYQEGRYLLPVLPLYILIAFFGLETALDLFRTFFRGNTSRIVAAVGMGAITLLMVIRFGAAYWENRVTYADYCRYIGERQVRTAEWLRDHLPPDAVVATHDIGAIGYYSGRRIVDMVGLVSPEMIRNIGSLDKLRIFLAGHRVTHIAVLRNWFTIVNANPLFQTDVRYPEIMEVFAYDPATTHFTPQAAGRLTEAAAYYLAMGNLQQAGPLLEQSLRIDSRSSRSHALIGRVYLLSGDIGKAEASLHLALELQRDNRDAQLGMAEVAARRDNPREAVVRLESILTADSTDPEIWHALGLLYQRYQLDSVKASSYLQRSAEMSARRAR